MTMMESTDSAARYLYALRFALSSQANAYGFTLVIWGTGALATWQLGQPDPADVFAYLGGALVAVSLIVALVFGVRRPFEENEPPRRPFSAMHLASRVLRVGVRRRGRQPGPAGRRGGAALAPGRKRLRR